MIFVRFGRVDNAGVGSTSGTRFWVLVVVVVFFASVAFVSLIYSFFSTVGLSSVWTDVDADNQPMLWGVPLPSHVFGGSVRRSFTASLEDNRISRVIFPARRIEEAQHRAGENSTLWNEYTTIRALTGNERDARVSWLGGVPVFNYNMATVVATAPRKSALRTNIVQTRPKLDDLVDWIVKFRSTSSTEDIRAWCQDAGTCLFEGRPSQGGLAMSVLRATPRHLDSLLRSHSGVDFVEPDLPTFVPRETVEETTKTEMTADRMSWGLDRIDDRFGLDGSFDVALDGGSGVHVYVADTGILTTHKDFGGRAQPALEISWHEVIQCDPFSKTCAVDRHGHGTHCAGIAGGETYGVARGANLHAVKVTLDDGSGAVSWMLEGLDWVVRKGQRPAIFSASLGFFGKSPVVQMSIDEATAAGVIVVVAAGNENSDACEFAPSFVPSSITVAATTRDDVRADYSNFGPCVDMFAPGSEIISAHIDSDEAWAVLSGTSMACPHVAGAAALLLGANGSRSAVTIKSLLLSTATIGAVNDTRGTPNLLLYVETSAGNGTTVSPTTSALAPTTIATSALFVYRVEAGSCTADERGCVSSPHYPNPYGTLEFCEITINTTFFDTNVIATEAFETEGWFDRLTVNGESYYGTSGPDGLQPRTQIMWSSDGSGTAGGWKLCARAKEQGMTTMVAPPPTTDLLGSFGAFMVDEGPCVVDNSNCVTSPNYPNPYGNREFCKIVINATLFATHVISVESFETEDWVDELAVNGKWYSGSAGPDGVQPTEPMLWWSDDAYVAGGWKLCTRAIKPTPVSTSTTFAPTSFVSYRVDMGSCVVDEDDCVTSPHYPKQYDNFESCEIAVNATFFATHVISVEAFETEEWLDELLVNGVAYSGRRGPDGVQPATVMTWSANSSIAARGWKLCTRANALAPTEKDVSTSVARTRAFEFMARVTTTTTFAAMTTTVETLASRVEETLSTTTNRAP